MGEIRKGQKVKLCFTTVDNSDKEVDCFIKEIYSDRLFLTISQKISDYSQYLEEGNELAVRIFTPIGVKVFDTIILNSPLESDFVIEYIEDSPQIQRREYTRVELKTKVIIEREDKDNLVTHTIDISGGGLRFFSQESFEPEESVGVLLYLPFSIRSIQAQAIIVKNEYLQENQYVLLFTKIEERERDKIVKQCFEVQAAQYNEIEKAE